MNIYCPYITAIKTGAIGIIPTDTLYGIVGSAFDTHAVERIYTIKKRTPDKPYILLISEYHDLEKFGIAITETMQKILATYWPGPVSIILPCPDPSLEYLHRGRQSLAFRLPKKEDLREFLRETGPLVAPSANPEGMPPAKTAEEAREYFGDTLDFYVDGGTLDNPPSKLISIAPNGTITTLR